MSTKRLNNKSSLAAHPHSHSYQQTTAQTTAQKDANSLAIREELQFAIERLQSTQEELRQKNQLLETAYQTLDQERQLLQAAHRKIREQAILLNITTDLANREQLEAQLQHTQRLESLGILASGVVHDLNNVLTPILSLSQLLRSTQSKLDDRSQKMLHLIENSAKRGADLTQQILSFMRKTDGDSSPVQLVPLLQDVINALQPTLPPSIRIEHPTPSQPLWCVAADPAHLYQVVMNLCVNARDAMPDGGVLTLSIDNQVVDPAWAQTNLSVQGGNYVVVTVTDTGTGIPPEVRDRIFEPFFTTKQPGRGTGLGLATVLGIVKTYRGFLQVCSEVGAGTSVKVYLPALNEPPNVAI